MALKLIIAGSISVIFLGILTTHLAYSCNEMICASIVSKCMLTKSCNCDLKNCSCCKECYNCLNYLYNECCSCVDMCPKPNETKSALSTQSLVDDLEGIPGLFKALTIEDDPDKKWTAFTFPVDFAEALFKDKIKEPIINVVDSPDQDLEKLVKLHTAMENAVVTVNCTVAYLSQCLSWGKCKNHCNQMGATSVRWFQDGCCQCVGQTCINYGIKESRCLMCPEDKDDDTVEEPRISEDDLDYGEGMGPLDGTVENTNI